MPGLLLCFVMRFDAYKRNQLLMNASEAQSSSTTESLLLSTSATSSSSIPSPLVYNGRSYMRLNRLSYFHCSLIGYLVGLVTATLSSEIFKAAQPALLYLVPFTFLPFVIIGFFKVFCFFFFKLGFLIFFFFFFKG